MSERPEAAAPSATKFAGHMQESALGALAKGMMSVH
jgi:hypothetical protein